MSDAEVQQLASDHNITPDPTKGTVVVSTSGVSSASVSTSAVSDGLTVLLYSGSTQLDVPTVVSGSLVVFFNVPPGNVEVRVIRGDSTIYTESVSVVANAKAEVRAQESSATGAQVKAEQAITNLLSTTPDVHTASTDFTDALAKDPNNDLALLGSAIAEIYLLPETSAEIDDILNTLGYSAFDPNGIFNATALVTKIGTATAVVRGERVQKAIDSEVIPKIDDALDKLGKVGSDFQQMVNTVDVDYSDVLALRVNLLTLKGIFQTINAYNADIPDVTTPTSVRSVLDDNPSVGKSPDTTRLSNASTTLSSALDMSISFIDALQGETDSQDDDFIEKQGDTRQATAFKDAVQDIKKSLQGSSQTIRSPKDEFRYLCAESFKIDLHALFAGDVTDLRDLFPDTVTGQYTDPTFKGVFPDSTDGHPVQTGTTCPTSANATTGSSLYGDRCVGCHGDHGAGGSAPDIRWADTSEVLRAVGTGSMKDLAPLTPQEAVDLEAFLRQ